MSDFIDLGEATIQLQPIKRVEKSWDTYGFLGRHKIYRIEVFDGDWTHIEYDSELERNKRYDQLITAIMNRNGGPAMPE